MHTRMSSTGVLDRGIRRLAATWCRRKVYDSTGSLEDTEALSGDAFDDLYSYYRTVYPKVTEDDIEKVSGHSQHSLADCWPSPQVP